MWQPEKAYDEDETIQEGLRPYATLQEKPYTRLRSAQVQDHRDFVTNTRIFGQAMQSFQTFSCRSA